MDNIRILVDGDACPVKKQIEKVAKEFNIKVIMYIDVNHILKSDYSEIVTVSQGKDSVDLCLINNLKKGDIAVTQDYGVAALALGKGAYAIGNSGKIYDSDNIEQLMFERFLSSKVRRAGKKAGRMNNPKKRTSNDDERFEYKFRMLCKQAMKM